MLGQRNHNIDDGAIFLWIKQYEEHNFHLWRATSITIIEKNAHFLRQEPKNNCPRASITNNRTLFNRIISIRLYIQSINALSLDNMVCIFSSFLHRRFKTFFPPYFAPFRAFLTGTRVAFVPVRPRS